MKKGKGNVSQELLPVENPLTAITLHFKDGAALRFDMEKPVRQVEVMAFIGEFCAKTGNPLKMAIPDTPL
mgnify:CR=1 FL=1